MPPKNDPELSALDAERERIDLELKVLQLEDLRDTVERRRAQKSQKKQSRDATEAALADSRAQQLAREQECPHRKGGKDMEGLRFGNSQNFSVIKHMLAHGEVFVLCQRCHKEWRRPDRALLKPEAYAEAMREYRRALDLPTDNVPSGTRLFAVEGAA